MEEEHEIRGLRFWDGDPTARLLMADHDLGAMLLERCEPGTVLRALPEREQDVVISGLLRRLWRAPSAQHPLRPLSALTKYWSDETLAQIEQWPDPGLVYEGLRLFAELPRTQSTELLLATDLHAGNVLRAERQPWLVIDPKPFVGDPVYDATQHLLIVLQSDPDATIGSFAELLGVDYERVRLWTFRSDKISRMELKVLFSEDPAFVITGTRRRQPASQGNGVNDVSRRPHGHCKSHAGAEVKCLHSALTTVSQFDPFGEIRSQGCAAGS